MKHAQGTSNTNAAPKPWPQTTALPWPLLASVLLLAAGVASANTVTLFEEDFESELVGTVWDLTGDWRFRINSPCLPNELGFISPDTALVFDYAGACSYRNSRSGFATMKQDVHLPITTPSVSLKWWDYVGAEEGHDFYFVQISTDGGQTWPHEVFRDSVDEDFWDEEVVDLSQFVGQSIRVRFGFSADASISNRGWYIDNVRIEGEGLPAGVSALAIQDARFKEGLTIEDVAPGDPDPAVVEFRVLIAPPNAQPITFQHATVEGTALSGLDFVPVSGMLTIPPNTSSFVIPFTKVPVPGNPGETFSRIIDDLFFEDTEEFSLVISAPSANAVIAIGTATGVIEDNEELTFLYTENFEGNQPAQFKFDPLLLNPDVPLNGWQVLEDSDCLAPQPGFTSASRALAFSSGGPNCSYYTPGGVEGIVAMINPVLISGVNALAAQVRFMHYLEIAYQSDSIESVPSRAFVEASKQNGVPGSWKVLREFGPNQPAQDPFVLGWREEVIDLRDFLANDPPLDPLDPDVFNVFNDENVLIRFRFVQPPEDMPNTAAGWYIDDLKFGVAPRRTDPLVSKLSVTAPWAPDTPDLPDYQPKAVTEGDLGTRKLRFPVRFKPVNTEPITIAYETVELETRVDNTPGTTTTRDRTLRRRASVCGGSPNGFADPTDITDQWDGFPQNTFNGLGAYTSNCTPAEIDTMYFSEYVEGSGSNKALEIFNGTGNTVDLSTYTVELYPNGSPLPSDTLLLSDIQPFLANNDTLVIANAAADPAILAVADFTHKVTAFNGNDAIALRENGVLVDVIGVIGSDPGTEWGIGKVLHAATADVDYVSASGTITIPAGTDTDVTPVFIDVLMIGDDEPEPAEEYFGLRLGYVTQNYFLVDEFVTGVIYDDDDPSTFEVFVRGGAPGDRTVSEGDGAVQFTVQMDPPRSVPIGVRYKTIDGTALGGPGLDYLPASGVITFPANVSQATITVSIIDDDVHEPTPESFFIALSTESPFATGGDPHEITILDNDPFDAPPVMTISDTSVTEGSCATISAPEPCNGVDTDQPLNVAIFTVEVVPAPTALTGNYTIDFTTMDGTAVAGEDYEAVSGTLIFAEGETSKEVHVRVFPDRAVEGDETFMVTLSNPQGGYAVVKSVGVATIGDDDYLATAFGVNGFFINRRNFDEEVAQNVVIAGGASADFTAAEFRSFDFDVLYGWDGNDLKKIDLTTRISTTIATVTPPGLVTWSGLAWDHTNGKLYGAETGGKIYEIDPADGAIVGAPVIDGAAPIVAIAVHPTSGRLYVVTNDGVEAKLHVAIPGKDALVEVGPIAGVTPSADASEHPFWDCDFDDASGLLYLNAYVLNDGLVTLAIDLETAASALVFSSPEVSSFALATPPTPQAVLWSNDLYFDSTEPSGTGLVASETAFANAGVGFAVSGVGDVNGDAFEDLIVTAPDANGGLGEAFLFFGSPGLEAAAVSEIVTSWFNSDFTFEPAFFDGNQAVRLRGEGPVRKLGRSVTGLGDINGDNIADFALGYETVNGAGGVYVIFGRRQFPGTVGTGSVGSIANGATVAGLRIPGAAAGDNLGFSIAAAGDVNGDGFGDFLLGAPHAASPSGGNPGAVYLIFGSNSGIGTNGQINLPGLTRQRGVSLYGENDGDRFGFSLDGAGDVNGDGLDDIVIGAPLADFRTATQANPGSPDSVDEGAAFVLYGHPDYGTSSGPLTIDLSKLSNAVFSPPSAVSPNKLAFTSAIPAEGSLDTTINPQNDLLNTLTGALPGYRLRGEGGRLGASVAGVGDMNGNGIGEVAMGAPEFDGSAGSDPHWGRVYLLYGDDGRGGVVRASDVGTVHRGQILTGMDNGDLFGGEVAAAGDLNGDGFMDVVFGVAAATPGGFSGEAYVLWGGPTEADERLGTLSMRDLAGMGGADSLGRYFYNTQGGSDFAFGRSVSAAGDFNNDNVGDLIIGRKGGAFLFYGGENPVAATYVNRMRSGQTGTPTMGEDGQVTSGSVVFRGIGEIGGRSFSAPASRVAIRFTGGGTGINSVDVSTQQVTLVREESPDVIVGSGSPEDDAAWVPGGVYWNVQTDRDQFSAWEIEFYYRPEEVAGLDLQRVGMFRAKESIDAVGAFTTWFWLPFEHDPDRKVFTVKQTYPSNPEPNAPTPQELFNGTYALVQADLVTELGKEIRPVGVTRDNVYEQGPDFTPGMAFWHQKEKKLYATKAGPITVQWKNTVGQTVSVIRGQNRWPADSSGLFQPYMSGSPNVPLANTGGLFEFQSVQLVGIDNESESIGVNNDKEFFATLTGASANQAVRALVLLSTDANPNRGDLFFQFIRVVKPENAAYRVGAFTGVPWNIGTSIGADSDPAFAANHDDVCGAPYLISTNTPYAPATARYPGFYDQATRSGTIVPVNEMKAGDDDMVLTFYQAGRRLTDAKTGNQIRDPRNLQPISVFCWPHATRKYNPRWAPDSEVDTIIISNQDGTGALDPGVYGTNVDIYVQNDPALDGFNPNEEHALIAPFGAGIAIFALRDDLNGAESQAYVLMTYTDPNDLNAAGEQRAKMKPWRVVAQTPAFPFAERPGVSFPDDLYEGQAGSIINPPYPLSVLRISRDNTFSGGPVWKDRNSSLWAVAATGPSEDEKINMRFYYPVLEGFYFPQKYKDAYSGVRTFTGSNPDDVPWLDGGVSLSAPALPVKVQYITTWPATAPQIRLGDILIGPKQGLPAINGQCSVNVVYQESTDVTKTSSPAPSVELIDPVVTRSVFLEEVPMDIKTGFQGTSLIFTDLPPALQFRVTYNQSTQHLEMKGILIEPTAGDDYVLLNVLTAADVERLEALSTDADWLAAVTAIANADTGAGAVKRVVERGFQTSLAANITATATTFNVTAGTGEGAPEAPFLLEIRDRWNPIDREVVLVTERTGDEFTVTRAQRETVAKAFEAGDIVQNENPADAPVDPPEVLALSTGNAQGTGYVTLAFGGAGYCDPLPVSVQIIRVVDDIVPGGIAVVEPGCVFEEKLTLMHTNAFNGVPENFYFEWLYLPPDLSPKPFPDPPDVNNPADPWTPPPLTTGPPAGVGLSEITIAGPGLLTLTDNWFAVRYKRNDGSQPWGSGFSDWTPIQLAPGWLKRVVGQINPFTQRASGGGIAGAESSFASFGSEAPNRIVSMISQAGPRWDGDVPLSCETIDDFGLIPIYETVLGRGSDLSIRALPPIDHPGVNTALLLVASRINDLYTLLGNEAYADAQDPTIGFGTDDGTYGQEATSIHAFMNQVPSLLHEELALLRGRDDVLAPSIQTRPFYNKLVWNFSNDITGGEVAYALNYNIRDVAEGPGVGVISEDDAKRLYPQGHGDAWGHYLTAMKTYYKLLTHPFYTWVPRSETILVGGQPLTVDYLDERKFARTAAAKAQAGAEIVELSYREVYTEDPTAHYLGYKDSNTDRAWGFSEWSSRSGQGAYLDWVVGNAILRSVDPNPFNEGIARVDRFTVPELRDIATSFDSIRAAVDKADLGLNPLGLGTNVIPFDISPSEIDEGKTHFEQIFSRAVTSLNNASQVFNRANNSTQLLRQQADTQAAFDRGVVERELDFNARLIEIFGYPYPEDIGPGKTYPTGYSGPDLYHYMYRDQTAIERDQQLQSVYFQNSPFTGGVLSGLPTIAESFLADFVADPRVNIGDGNDVTFNVKMANYLTQGAFGEVFAGATTLGGSGQTEVLPRKYIEVAYNMQFRNGSFGLVKPAGWSSRRAPGELQLATAELQQAVAEFMKGVDDYGGLVGGIEAQVAIVAQQYNVSAEKLRLLNTRLDGKKTTQDIIFGLKTTLGILNTAASVAEAAASWFAESIPTVTGIIVGFSNGVIIDGLAPARGALGGVGVIISEALKAAGTAVDLAELRLSQQGERKDDQLTIDTTDLEDRFSNFQAIKELESQLRNEVPLRIALHTQYQAVLQAVGNYQKILAEGQRLVDRRELFRNQTSADIQSFRYKDAAFRIFRNDALQKYRAQFDLASRYVYLAAKAYDYETTMLPSDSMAGQRFLNDIVKARTLGAITDGVPQTGTGLANSMAVMARNFEVLSTQLGFNNPQVETNRFSLRTEFLRTLPGEAGDPVWSDVLARDYHTHGIGTVDNLWDVPEFRRYCVPPAGFGNVEPGIIIPFSTSITEGENFFGAELGGFDSSYDSTQFATKIRSVGIWFSNYDFLNLSNTPRVYLVPVGNDLLRSPTSFSGKPREFFVSDQLMPVPFPIAVSELDDPAWIPSIDSLSGTLSAIRRFGRLRAYHDSGEFSPSEVNRDSRLIGRSVWNTQWMLIIPGSTLHGDAGEGIRRFVDGRLRNPGGPADGERDGNGVSDIKLFFETYAFPRLKK